MIVSGLKVANVPVSVRNVQKEYPGIAVGHAGLLAVISTNTLKLYDSNNHDSRS
jgi:hypothetical protein